MSPINKKIRWGIIIFLIISSFAAIYVTQIQTRFESRADGTIISTSSGRWSNPSTWQNNKLPTPNDKVIIGSGHTVILDTSFAQVSGLDINQAAVLQFQPNLTTTLTSNKNIIVKGILSMQPSLSSINHKIHFVNVDETKFIGSGMSPLDTDIGLWVINSGKLDLQGSPKLAWSRLKDGTAKGALSITLLENPTGWQIGDEIVIAPTEDPTYQTFLDFDEAEIKAINGNTITLDRPLKFPHPKINNLWTAEVMNLTRNVQIEGNKPQFDDPKHDPNRGSDPFPENKNGRAHIFIHNTEKAIQNIKNIAIRYMGPRKADPDKRLESDSVLGRYGLHFHMSMDHNRESIVDGVVIRDTGSHAFVPHASHGITIKNSISYNTYDSPYWWDKMGPDTTNNSRDIIFDHNIAALAQGNIIRLSGFQLGAGPENNKDNVVTGNIIKNSTAVGIMGGKSSSGFHWPEDGVGRWEFNEGNIAHNNRNHGIFVWQNSPMDHLIKNYIGYHNGAAGINHGAYSNLYNYENIILYGNKQQGIILDAVAKDESKSTVNKTLSFKDIIIDGAGITEKLIEAQGHNDKAGPVNNPTLFTNLILKNPQPNQPAFQINGGGLPDVIDCVNCEIPDNKFFLVSKLEPDTLLRIQLNSGEAFTLRRFDQEGLFIPEWNARRSNIPPFANVTPPQLPTVILSPTPIANPTTSIPSPTISDQCRSDGVFGDVNCPTLTTNPSVPPKTTISPGNLAVSLRILLHGIGRGGDSANPNSGGNINPLRTQRTFTIEILNSQNQLVLSKDTTLLYNQSQGNFTGSLNLGDTIAAGNYIVKVKTNQFLKSIVPGIQSMSVGSNILPITTLITGDSNNDNRLDIADYNILLDCFSDLEPARNCSDNNKKLSADLNDDGNVNQFDYNLFLRELTNRQGE